MTVSNVTYKHSLHVQIGLRDWVDQYPYWSTPKGSYRYSATIELPTTTLPMVQIWQSDEVVTDDVGISRWGTQLQISSDNTSNLTVLIQC